MSTPVQWVIERARLIPVFSQCAFGNFDPSLCHDLNPLSWCLRLSSLVFFRRSLPVKKVEQYHLAPVSRI